MTKVTIELTDKQVARAKSTIRIESGIEPINLSHVMRLVLDYHGINWEAMTEVTQDDNL